MQMKQGGTVQCSTLEKLERGRGRAASGVTSMCSGQTQGLTLGMVGPTRERLGRGFTVDLAWHSSQCVNLKLPGHPFSQLQSMPGNTTTDQPEFA